MPHLAPLESWEEPRVVRMTTPYLKRLLIERHGIRAKLENPGGSVVVSSARKVEVEAIVDYSTVLGNDFHLDLLDAERVVNTIPAPERALLLQWCDGVTDAVAAEFAGIKPGAIQKRRERLVKRLVRENTDAGANA